MATKSQFQLFPGEDGPSPGDHLVRWLIDQQTAANERLSDGASKFAESIGFSKESLDKITANSDNRRQQMNNLFGLSLGKQVTGQDIAEAALGFGVSIKGITGLPKGLSISLPKAGRTKQELAQIETKNILRAGRGPQENQKFSNLLDDETGNIVGVRNVGGTAPKGAILEQNALIAQADKAHNLRVDNLQKRIDGPRLAVVGEETPPMQSINANGQVGTAFIAREGDPNGLAPGQEVVAFHSKGANAIDPHNFKILSAAGEEGMFVEVNYHGELFANPKVRREVLRNLDNMDIVQHRIVEEVPDREATDDIPFDSTFIEVSSFEEGFEIVDRILKDATEQKADLHPILQKAEQDSIQGKRDLKSTLAGLASRDTRDVSQSNIDRILKDLEGRTPAESKTTVSTEIEPFSPNALAKKSRTDLLNLSERIGFDDVNAGKKAFADVRTRIARSFGIAGEGLDKKLKEIGLSSGVLKQMQSAYDRGVENAFRSSSLGIEGQRPEGPPTTIPTEELEKTAIDLYRAGNTSGFSEDFVGKDAQTLSNIVDEIASRNADTPFDTARSLREKAATTKRIPDFLKDE